MKFNKNHLVGKPLQPTFIFTSLAGEDERMIDLLSILLDVRCMKRIPRKTRLAHVLSYSLILLAGCGSASDNLPRQAVSGSVTLDGKPLEAGSITFDPADLGQAGVVNAGASIYNGSYSISRDIGLTPGNYRVSVLASSSGTPASKSEAPGRPAKVSKAALIPAKYNSNTTLKAEVKPSGNGAFDFTLTSK